MKKIYIAGPMTGKPHFNAAAFDAASDYWKAQGWETFNPADKDRKTYGDEIFNDNPEGCPIKAKESYNLDIRDVLAVDLDWICKEADAIYMLQGWENSKGAKAEHATAHAIGLEFYYE